MTVAAYRDRASSRYPVFTPEIREKAGALFGDEPPAEVLDALGLDPVQATTPPTYDPAKQTLSEGEPAKSGDAWKQTWTVGKLPAPSVEAVNAERDRRLNRGVTFAGHLFQTDDEARARINTARMSAAIAIMGGVQPGDLRWPGVDKDFFWIAADDVRVPMDAQTMVAFGNSVAAREGLLIVAGNDLKQRIAAGEAISNIGDDKLWPA
ncbi:DUF4376 domain-containing protein [Aureimonas ureilytica]|uniref:DUF4376 domain-containing protein n=1 Tax=Aureimonas ureilytica TaxID=401562 RepID=UPI00036BAEAB|nr:DUF4376 domain-containing protein [Aureimonas ureilytica]